MRTSKMNGLSCIYWCITYAACVGVVIPHNGGDDCFYVTSIGNKIADESMDQYDISRVCKGRDMCEYGNLSLYIVVCYYYFSLKCKIPADANIRYTRYSEHVNSRCRPSIPSESRA